MPKPPPRRSAAIVSWGIVPNASALLRELARFGLLPPPTDADGPRAGHDVTRLFLRLARLAGGELFPMAYASGAYLAVGRPSYDFVRRLRDSCLASGVPFALLDLARSAGLAELADGHLAKLLEGQLERLAGLPPSTRRDTLLRLRDGALIIANKARDMAEASGRNLQATPALAGLVQSAVSTRLELLETEHPP